MQAAEMLEVDDEFVLSCSKGEVSRDEYEDGEEDNDGKASQKGTLVDSKIFRRLTPDCLEKEKSMNMGHIVLASPVVNIQYFKGKKPIFAARLKLSPGYTLKKGAESSKNIQIQWTYGRYACTTDFRIYYTETAKGRIILVGSDIDLKNSENGHAGHTVIKNKARATMEERLLNAIFGEPSDWLPDITAGYGFEFNEIPEGFGDFLNAHADTFCDSEENIRLYNRFVAGEKPEDVFEDFCVNGWSCGPGAVVADIMSKETGREYQYFEPDKNVSEENRNACVMERAKENFVLRIEEQTLLYLFKCAKELKIPEFGAVYHYGTCTKAVNQIYQTDKFWLE